MKRSETELDPYEVLGVPRTATAEEIRAAYLALVRKFHPDQHHGHPLEELAAERLAQINRAYEILSDVSSRKRYDASLPMQGRAASGRFRPLKVIGLLLAGVLIIRFLPLVFRLLEGLFGLIFRSLAGLRGTPFVAAGVALLALFLIVALMRRRRKK